MASDLTGKIAIVTGASRGIGEATALELARSGAKVTVTSRSLDALQNVADRIKKAGGEAHIVKADMRETSDLEKIVGETTERFGGVDILVNNAGISAPAKQIYNYTLDDWEETMKINLRAPWYLSNLVHRTMRERGGGSIVNISSTSGLHHDIGLGIYGISKAGVVFLTLVCAKEWARDKIRVNCLAPGVVKTELAKPILGYLESHNEKPNPLNIVGDPEEIANLIRYLVSDESRYITGDVIRIDGGELL